MKQLKFINTIEKLLEVLDLTREFKLYGAGYYLNFFLDEIGKIDKKYGAKISCIMVSDRSGNPESIKGIPVMDYRDAEIVQGDYVLLTLGDRFVNEVYDCLKDTGASIIQINYNMFQEIPYNDVKKSIQPFLDRFPEGTRDLNMPSAADEIICWSCWWQGEEQAPEIVKACLESQRRGLPKGVKHVVITENNYQHYVVLPNYVIAKVKSGDIAMAVLSDMIRASLLYKYGGFWMDATLYVLEPLEEEIMKYPIYTRNLPETQFCAKAMWAGWFLYAEPGNKLFRFLEEGLFYYFSVFDRLNHYLTIDYIIAIACNTFPEIESQLKAIPFNNEKALELSKHLMEEFDECRYKKYVEGTFVQKLTYKINDSGWRNSMNTVYRYLIEK